MWVSFLSIQMRPQHPISDILLKLEARSFCPLTNCQFKTRSQLTLINSFKIKQMGNISGKITEI
jgi:hypothetical protein